MCDDKRVAAHAAYTPRSVTLWTLTMYVVVNMGCSPCRVQPRAVSYCAPRVGSAAKQDAPVPPLLSRRGSDGRSHRPRPVPPPPQAAAVSADVVIMVVDAQQGWTRADSDIFTALWGEGPGTASCRVQGLAMLVANKCDLLPQAGEANFII